MKGGGGGVAPEECDEDVGGGGDEGDFGGGGEKVKSEGGGEWGVDSDSDGDGGGGYGFVVVVVVGSEGGGGEHITGHVTQSVMQKRPLDGASMTLSADVTAANKANPMNPNFEIQENRVFLMSSPKFLLSPI